MSGSLAAATARLNLLFKTPDVKYPWIPFVNTSTKNVTEVKRADLSRYFFRSFHLRNLIFIYRSYNLQMEPLNDLD